ncbi:MAG: amidohydrolase [Desulfuromonadales bacterium]|nr:amidohydrolase [Desulfuromonadales bacterium]
MRSPLRIGTIAMSAAAVWLACVTAVAQPPQQQPVDLIVTNAKVHTMDDQRPQATAFAVRDGKFVAVGDAAEVGRFRGAKTRRIDARGHTLIPGLNDSHAHAIRGGRFYNLELRWDGVDSLARALGMIREQAQRTPPGQWVRVIGGWSPYQFAEKRMPTVKELNEAAPDTPTFVLFLYSQGIINRAAVQALGLTEQTPAPEGGRYEFVDGGAILHAEPNPLILYQMIAKPPQLSAADQVNSTLHFYREMNRLGMTSAVDAGGGGHAFPTDYAGSQELARKGEMPVRISYYLFAQTPGKEAEDFERWVTEYQVGRNEDKRLEHGFELEGGGEFLAHSAGDWENFLAARPTFDARLAAGQDPFGDLHEIATILVKNRWPLHLHATYGETIRHVMGVFEKVKREQGRFAPRWAIDHAETVADEELRRIKAMGGGIAIQNRMAFAGEFFVERYGREAVRHAPPIRKMLDLGIPVGAGTDGTRVSSFNPWPSMYWLVTGKTVGGMQLFAEDNRLTREEALRLFTAGSAWFSQEEDVKGRIAPGMYADFAVLSDDYFSVPEERIKRIESLLTVVGGRVVYAAGPFAGLGEGLEPPPLPPVSPAWSPVAHFGGYQSGTREATQQ